MRLIDADALEARMYHEAFETDSNLQKWDSGCWIRYKMFENAMAEAPTVDAEPIRRGKWTKLPDGEYMCSECGFTPWYYRSPEESGYKQCPRCGARMGE